MSIVDTAKSTVGNIKYSFGATAISDNGTGTGDCSSFTQWVLKQNGINVGRTTEEQWTNSGGEKVNKSDLQAGDVIFFKNTYDSNYTDGVSHVGIYIGDGKFVHNSSGAGKTTISNLSSSYYSEHYLGAKRFTDDNTVSGDSVNTTSSGSGDTDLKWWGDIILVIMVILVIALCLVFFLKAFGIKAPTAKNLIKG